MSDIKESIRRLEKSILEDGKVDRAEAQILLAFAKSRVADHAEMAEFVKALKRYNLDLNSWADQVSKYVNAKYVPPPEIKVPSLFTPKAINDALDREQKKRR